MNQRRQYDETILDRIAVIRLARAAGFTIAETKALVGGFQAGTSPAAQWRSFARRKQREVELRISHERRILGILEMLLTCTCQRLEECGRFIRERVSQNPLLSERPFGAGSV
jgi:DNA-binding transcriptional MerR regulator